MLTNFLPNKRERFQKVWKKVISEPYGSTHYPTQQEVKDLMVVLQDYDELLAQVEELPSSVIQLANERARQIEKEGFDYTHDDQHANGELADAAASYALSTRLDNRVWTNMFWPWSRDWLKISDDPIRNLTKAGALIAAEIDRLIRKNNRDEYKENLKIIRSVRSIDDPKNNRIA